MKPWLLDLEIRTDAERLISPLGSTLFDAFLEFDTFIRHESYRTVRKSRSHQGHRLILISAGDFQKLKVILHLLADPEMTFIFVDRICQLLESHALRCFSNGGQPFVGGDRLREVMLEGQSQPPLRDLLQLREDLKRAARSPVAGPADKAYFDGLRRLARGES